MEEFYKVKYYLYSWEESGLRSVIKIIGFERVLLCLYGGMIWLNKEIKV